MREIKFKAWDGDSMLYVGDSLVYGSITNLWLFTHNQDSLMQYTGLKDKNGDEIYEGDIVSHAKETSLTPKCTMVGKDVVLWQEEKARFILGKADLWGMIYKEYEILGNIHENPELL